MLSSRRALVITLAVPYLWGITYASEFDRLIAARRAVTAGHVVFSVEGTQLVYDDSGRNPLEKAYSETVEIWFDGDRLRADRTPSGGGSTVVSCFGCAGDGTHVYYSNTVLPSGDKVALTVASDDAINPPQDAVPDPRWAGVCLAPFRLIPFIDGEQILSSARECSVENLENQRVRVVWDRDSRGRYDVHLRHDPPGIDRMVFAYGHGGQAYVETLVVENKLYTVGSVRLLYPERIRFQQTVDGTVRMDESVRVITADFRVPDPAVFSLSRIPGLDPGTPVHWALSRDRPVPRGPLEWDGNAVVGVFSGDAEELNGISGDSRSALIRRIIIALNVVIASFLVIMWVGRRMRRAKQ